MADKSRLLKVKATLKKRQPVFQRQGSHKLKRVKRVWRAPKGLHSKMRDSRRGYHVKIQGGYQTPKAVRGLDKNGLLPTIVAGIKQLEQLDPKVHSIILQGGLGGRKKLAIIEEANKRKFTINNAKADLADKIKARLTKQHEEKKARASTKTEKQKQLEAKEKDAKTKKDAEKSEGKTDTAADKAKDAAPEHKADHSHGKNEKHDE
jgi:large subunit ribosomal protein L32e